MTAVDGLGYLAAALVLATFCAKSMVPLRALAIASNIAFVTCGFFAGLWPILLLHSVMLPMNTMRLREAVRSQHQAVLRPPEFAPDFGGRQTTLVPNGTRGTARTGLIT
jgi:hypothetical protein